MTVRKLPPGRSSPLTPGGKRRKIGSKPGVSAVNKALWQNPEYLEKMKARNAKVAKMRAEDPHKFTRSGIPHGMTRETVAPLVAQARQQADRMIQMFKDEGKLPDVVVIPDSDEARAEAALKEACVIALSPGEKQAKMAAIRTVLEWTRAKPASKSNININTSEQWLAEIAAENDAD